MKRIGIIGEGKMGSNLFYYLTDFDYPLTWICSREADPEKLLKSFRKKILRSLDASVISTERFETLQSGTVISSDLADLSGCDLVIEAVNENLPLKQALFRQMDGFLPSGCILATNSSSIPPEAIVPSDERRDKTVGLHFFYPVILKNMAELIILPETSDKTKDAIMDFLTTIKKNVLLLHPENAFVLNRIFLDIQKEAWSVVSEGLATFRQLDEMVKERFTPTGVFEFCDHVGNDIMLASVMNYTRSDPEKDLYVPFMLKLDELVKSGRLGKKTGTGFFSYTGLTPAPEPEIPEGLRTKISERINAALQASVSGFAVKTGISEEVLNEHLEEYLGRR